MGLLSSIRESKLFYLGLPTLLLVLYVFLIPSPSVSQIQLQGDIGYIAEGYDFTILRLSPDGQITRKSSLTLPYWIKSFTLEKRIDENGIEKWLAYVITGNNSIHVIDVSDSSNPRKLSGWNSPGIAHSIAINGGFAYVASDSDGVRMLSVNEPSSPSEIMHIKDLGTVLDVASAQNLVYVARGPDGLDVYDTSSIMQSVSRGHYKTDGSINQITLLPENRALLLVNNNQVQIINFGNLQNIGLVNSFPFDTEIAQAVINGKRIFVAQKNAGLLIGRIKDDGTLERLTNISFPLYNVLDVAAIDNTIFIATGAGGLHPAEISKLDQIQFAKPYSRFFRYKRDVIILIVAVLLFWLAFFSQFVLPVRTFSQRQKIFERLLLFLIGRHGQAIFFRDGQPVKGKKEEKKEGPGVLWLDSASGVVTRTDAAFKNTFGPGVNFTDKGEKIAGQVDLHTQTHGIGPRESENPWAQKTDQQSAEELEAIQKRRNETSAWTRDGIEVIPNINVVFKIDADPVRDPNSAGSRFGYDANAVRLAITGQAINPNVPRDSNKYSVPWNQLPALLAVDVWRDLLSQFTLNDLFQPRFTLPPSFPDPPQPTTSEDPLYNPLKPQSEFADNLTSIIKELNRIISQLADWVEKNCNPKEEVKPQETSVDVKKDSPKDKKVTGLQVINFLLRERLQKQRTATLDRYGNYEQGQDDLNREHGFLESRGIRVLSASVSNLRLPADVDEKLISQWTANWLGRARHERHRLDQEEGFNRIENEENTLRDYIVQLSDDLLLQIGNNRARDLRQTLRSLMLESRVVLLNETQLFRQSGPEREGLEEIIQWLETRDL